MSLIEDEPTKHFESAGHALLTGQLLGMMMKEGWEAQPIMDKGSYTNQIVIRHPSITGIFVVEVQSSWKAMEELLES